MHSELKIDEVRAELKPEQKVAVIRELSEQGNRVAMIGDGVNDAPSLAVAHIGVAMGARGSDAALEQTVVVLVTFAMLGKIPLTLGVVGHEGSTVIVVMNSLRLLFGGKKK